MKTKRGGTRPNATHGGARPNSGGARPNSGPSANPDSLRNQPAVSVHFVAEAMAWLRDRSLAKGQSVAATIRECVDFARARLK